MKHIVLIGFLALALGLTGCGKPSLPESMPPSGLQSPPNDLVVPAGSKGIRTFTLQLTPIPDDFDVPARIQPDPTRVVRVFAPVTGRLITVEVRPGDRVRKGQTLATLESSEVSVARAEYQKARADSELKEQARRRASLLYENQVLAEKEYQQARADAEMAQAELARTRARLRLLGVDAEGSSDRLRVMAPRAGAVLDIGAAPGELSKSLDSPAPLCTLADLSTLWAVGDVFEKDMENLSVGGPAEVTANAYPGQKWEGPVATMSDALDPATRTLKIRVVLANPDWRLKPEMFASIRLFRSASSGVMVPASSVLREGSATTVFVEKSPGHFERRFVTLGRTLAQQIEVASGLKPGETVVVEGALLLRAATP